MDTNSIERALRQIEDEISVAEQALEELRLQQLGAKALLARMTGRPLERAGAENSSHGRPATAPSGEMGHKDFIEALLQSYPNGLHLREIQAKAAEAGRELHSEQVRSAVTYLKRRGRAETVSRGVWRLVDNRARGEGTPESTSAPAEAGAEAHVTATGTGGDSHAQSDQDHGFNLPGRNRDDRGGTSLTEVTSGTSHYNA